MDTWMDSAVDPAQEIQLKQCPRCKVTIRRNLRYGTVINRVLRDIEEVKKTKIGNHEASRIRSNDLLRRVKKLEVSGNFTKFYEIRLKISCLSENEISCIENITNFTEHVVRLQDDINSKVREIKAVALKQSLVRLKGEVESIKKWLMEERILLSHQQLRESSMEIERLRLLFNFYVTEDKLRSAVYQQMTPEKNQSFKDMMKLLDQSKMTEDLERRARDVLKSTQQCLSGLGVTEEERLQIVQAVGLDKGRWFKCPNGKRTCLFACMLNESFASFFDVYRTFLHMYSLYIDHPQNRKTSVTATLYITYPW
jgi:hypothetical protein